MKSSGSEIIYIAKPLKYLESNDSDGKVLKTESGETHSIDLILFDVLSSLHYPADMPLLQKRLAESGWDDSAFDALPEYIEELISMELAVPLDSLIGDYETQEIKEEYTYPDFYTFPTKDRPQELERALKAWLPLFNEASLTPGIIIADASVSSRDMNYAVLNSLKDKAKGGLYYFDNNSRWEFVRQFSAPVRKSAEFALSMSNDSKGISYGVNRNFIMLLTAGRKAAISDDDILPEFRTMTKNRDRLNLFSGLDPSLIFPVVSWKEIELLGTEAGYEDYSGIAKYAGESLKEFFSLCKQTDFNLASSGLLKNYTDGSAKAAVICHPYWGLSGMGSAAYLLSNRGSIKCDVFDRESYDNMMEKRLVFRAVENLTAGGKSFMGGHAVFDNSEMLPPFSPMCRNEDQLWSFLLDQLHPKSEIVYSPLSIKHDPPDPPKGSREAAARWKPGLNETIHLVLAYILWEKFPSECSYQIAGEAFREFLDKPEKERDEYLAELIMLAAQGRQRMLAANLEKYGEDPEWWAEDVYTAIEWINEYIKKERFWIPEDFRDSPDGFVNYCRSFSRLLIDWPAVYAEAREMNRKFIADYRL